jgi:4a-hydroxytetrahydrobiopterin dehydratase
MPARTYDSDEIAARLALDLPAWKHADGRLVRVFPTKGWKLAMQYANAIGHLAEAADHHPDLLVTWPRLEVRLMTHDAGGITDKDFTLAAEIERLIGWRPG